MTDYEHLVRILAPVLDLSEELLAKDLISTVFPNGTRLSFLTGPEGRLNAVIVQPPIAQMMKQARDD